MFRGTSSQPAEWILFYPYVSSRTEETAKILFSYFKKFQMSKYMGLSIFHTCLAQKNSFLSSSVNCLLATLGPKPLWPLIHEDSCSPTRHAWIRKNTSCEDKENDSGLYFQSLQSPHQHVPRFTMFKGKSPILAFHCSHCPLKACSQCYLLSLSPLSLYPNPPL